jgi:iron complex outermembrane receptor protein
LGGSINLRNNANWNKAFQFLYQQGAGSFGTFDEFIKVGGGNKKLHVSSRIYHTSSKNNYTFINRGIGMQDPLTGEIIHPTDTNKMAGYSRYGLLQEVYFKPGSEDVISAKYWGQKASRTLPRNTSYEGPDYTNRNNQEDIHHRLVFEWQHYSEASKWTIRSAFTSGKLDYSLNNMVPGLGLIPVVYSQSIQTSSLNKLAWSREFSESFSVEASLDMDVHLVSTSDSVAKTGYNARRIEQSAFVSIQKEFDDRLNMKVMLRQDHIDSTFAPPVPYLGFDLRISKTGNIFLKGNLGGNYRQPSLNDLFWQPGGNPDLLAEKGFSGELGIELTQVIGMNMLEGEITIFRSNISNWIIWIPGFKGYWEPRNIQNVKSTGIEGRMKFDGKIGELDYTFHGTYAYTQSLNYGDPDIWGVESYGKQLVYVPLHSANLMLRLNWNSIFASYQHNSYSERFTTTSNDISRRDWLYPYFMNDLSFGKSFGIKGLSLTAEFKIFNLFNETYHTILYRPMPGRHFLVLIKINV